MGGGGEAGWGSADAIETKEHTFIRKKGKGQKISRPWLLLDERHHGAACDDGVQHNF